MKNSARAIIVMLGLLAGFAEAADTFMASGIWTAPAGVTSVDIEVWGGGGAGGGQNQNSDGGGGGGGGAYSRVTGLTVVPGNNYTVVVGAGGVGVAGGAGGAGGDSWFIDVTTVMARGGSGGAPSTGTPPAGGAGGSAATSVGTTRFSGGIGGRGRDNNNGQGGPGGSSAGTVANGTSGPDPWNTTTAAAAPAGGGIGGNGGGNGANGFAPASGNGGGGGGSGEGANRVGGNGAPGMVIISYLALPAATTNAATAITTSTATFNGTVSSNGAATTVVFDYGLNTSYGSIATAAQSPLVAGATGTAVTANIIGLACGSTYHFRVRATNSVGTTNGNDLTFATTACPPPTATTNAATSITTTSAQMNGTVNDNGSTTTVTFQYGLTVAYGSTVTATQSPLGPNWGSMGVNATASGLTCGTTYHYRVRAVSAGGTTNGGDMTFTTSACPTSTSVTRSPGACVDNAGVGTIAWTALDAVASENSYATTSLNDWNQSHYLVCTNYGFTLPAGSTINGIVVNVERSATGSQIQDLRMRAVRGGVIGATDRSTATQYTTTDTVEAHGGAADLWGAAWTVANINAANFGAAFAAQKNGTAGGARTVNVDHMPITVYYTPSTPWVTSITRVSPSPTAANTSVSWDVLFSGNASGVDASDFQLIMGGAATGASITSVTINGSGRVWTVTANTGTGATGTLGLNLVDNDSITIGGVALGGAGANNGDFTGEVYTIEVPVCTGSMIYCDDFERANYGAVGNGWTITPGPTADCAGVAGNSGCAGIDTDIPPFNATTNRANPTRSMFTRWSVVTVESRPIDLSGHPSAILSFWMRRGGDSFSEYPEAVGEDYLVRYLDNTGTWRILAQYPTGVLQGQVFTPVIQLPPDAMHANFKLQYYQPAGSGDANGGTGGGAAGVVGYDYWHIDNVTIVEAPESSYTGAFCDNFEAGLGRWSVSAEGAPPTAAIGDADIKTGFSLSPTHQLDLRWGYVAVSTLRTDMTGVNGNIEFWIMRGNTAARAPDVNEDLVVEYFNSADTWVNLQTYTSTDAQAGATNIYSAPIPADARHSRFRLRFKQLNGSAFDNDYWHIDDVCVGTPQANADLSLTKTRSGPLVPGSNGTYLLTVTNNGPQDMSGTIQVVDTLPAGLGYVSGTGTGWTCTWNAPDATCSYVGSVANGASAPPITLVVAVDAGATGTITNTASVSGTVTDPVGANNTATNTTTLTPGFVFTDGPCVHGIAFGAPGQTCNPVTWTSMTAGQDRTNVYLTSVNTSTVPTQLSGSSATTVNLEFALTCHNPVADAGVQAVFTATAEALPLCEPNGAAPTNWTTGVDLSFASGNPSIGPYTFNYADVGQVELYARNSVATTQVGQSGPFVVRPAGFVLSQIECTIADATNCGAGALPSGNNPAASATGGPTFIRAGDPFSVTVTAVNALGNATPNYGREMAPESVRLSNSFVAETTGYPVLVLPAAGTNVPVATPLWKAATDYVVGQMTQPTVFNSHVYQVTNAGTSGAATPVWPIDGSTVADGGVVWRDVGVRLDTSLPAPYNQFNSAGVFTNGVATGTYQWSEVGIIQLTPRVLDGDYLGAGEVIGTTSGNVGRFYPHHFNTVVSQVAGVPMPCPDASCPPTYPGIAYSGQPFGLTVSALSASESTTTNYSAASGFAKSTALSVTGALGDVVAVPAGTLGVTSVNPFVAGVFTTNAENYTFDVATVPSNIYIRATEAMGGDGVTSRRLVDPINTSVEGGVQIVSGRLKVSNAYGSELLPLRLFATVQYFTTNGWVNNTDDSVTSLTLNATYPVGAGNTAASFVAPTDAACLPYVNGIVCNGVGIINLARPSAGSGVATVGPGAPAWLPVTSGTATFGVYRNPNSFIYRREN